MNQKLKPNEKYSLSIKEAGEYYSIGIKKMRRLAEDHIGLFSAYNGNRFLIIRAEFEEYLKKNPILPDDNETDSIKAQLEHKTIFSPEEAVLYYGLSRRKFKQLIEANDELPFMAVFKKEYIIIREEFEKYMEENPEIKEEIRSGKS